MLTSVLALKVCAACGDRSNTLCLRYITCICCTASWQHQQVNISHTGVGWTWNTKVALRVKGQGQLSTKFRVHPDIFVQNYINFWSVVFQFLQINRLTNTGTVASKYNNCFMQHSWHTYYHISCQYVLLKTQFSSIVMPGNNIKSFLTVTLLVW